MTEVRRINMPITPLLDITRTVGLPRARTEGVLVRTKKVVVPNGPVGVDNYTSPRIVPKTTALSRRKRRVHRRFSSWVWSILMGDSRV